MDDQVSSAAADCSFRNSTFRQELIVDVAIGPGFSDLARRNDCVTAFIEVGGRMTMGRRVAAADVPAAQANPQMHPASADFQAILASRWRPMKSARRGARDVGAGVRKVDGVVVRHETFVRSAPMRGNRCDESYGVMRPPP